MPKSTSVQISSSYMYIRFKLTKRGPQIYKFSSWASTTLLWGYFIICAPLPLSWTEEKEERKRMKGREGG